MRRILKNVSVILGVAVLVLATLSITALAAGEKRVDIGESSGCYVTVSNVVEEKTAGYYPLYIAASPVTIKFNGDGFSREFIYFIPQGKLQDGEFEWGDSSEEVKFTVKKYTTYGSKEVFDELLQECEDMPYYVSGNYATLTKPGYYTVNGAPEAAAGTTFIVQVTGKPSAESEPQVLTARPTASKVLVNGKAVSFEAYLIDGSNYFKLRDLAAAVIGTEKQFEVGWDNAANTINLTTEKTYTPVGGELAISAKPGPREARPTTSGIYLDGREVRFTAYLIGGNNYFKLRDVAKAIDFGVAWDGNTSTIGIDTSISYTE
jgi:hypothetical protein